MSFSKSRRPRLILGILLICVIAVGAFVLVSYLIAPVRPPVPVPLSPPSPPPAATGCYQYAQTQGWMNVTCSPSRQGHALEGGVPSTSNPPGSPLPGILGIASVSSGTSSPFVITRAEVQVAFTSETGELDSQLVQNQGGAFSIQLNTNFFPFTASDGTTHTGWVQFTFHNECTASCATAGAADTGLGVCVWIVDITKQNYSDNTCTNSGLSAQVLSSSYSATVGGEVVSTSSGTIVRATAYLPNGQIISASLPDTLGLASNWLQVSGTIVGYLNGSQAIFAGPTVENTYIFATSCPQGYPQGYKCNSPILNGEVIGYTGYPLPYGNGGTIESNDLSYTSPVAPDNSTLACSNAQTQEGQCTLSTASCFMNGGTTCVTSASIPGFPLEGIIIGLAGGLVLIAVKRRPSRQAVSGFANNLVHLLRGA